jgi:hypothetical protein
VNTYKHLCIYKCLHIGGLLESATIKGGINKTRQREAYLSYLEMLNKLQLFCAANSIISVSEEEYISKMNLQGVSMHTACSRYKIHIYIFEYISLLSNLIENYCPKIVCM